MEIFLVLSNGVSSRRVEKIAGCKACEPQGEMRCYHKIEALCFFFTGTDVAS